MNDPVWIWVRLKLRTIHAARMALSILSGNFHREARVEPDKKRASHLRAEADYYDEESESLRQAQMQSLEEDPQMKPKDD